MNETTAQVSKLIDARPEVIWKALISPDKLKQFFMGATVTTDWKVGSPIFFKGEFKGQPYEDRGKILLLEPGKTLAFSHYSAMTGQPDQPESYHVVTFDLSTATGATQVTITQSNLTGGIRPEDLSHRADYERNWTSVLEGLARAVKT